MTAIMFVWGGESLRSKTKSTEQSHANAFTPHVAEKAKTIESAVNSMNVSLFCLAANVMHVEK